MTDQQHKDIIRLQATLEFLTVNIVCDISAKSQPDGKPHPDAAKGVVQSINNLYERLCQERGLE